jgi:hypothetical protein
MTELTRRALISAALSSRRRRRMHRTTRTAQPHRSNPTTAKIALYDPQLTVLR